jgi:hypothetical protein
MIFSASRVLRVFVTVVFLAKVYLGGSFERVLAPDRATDVGVGHLAPLCAWHVLLRLRRRAEWLEYRKDQSLYP